MRQRAKWTKEEEAIRFTNRRGGRCQILIGRQTRRDCMLLKLITAFAGICACPGATTLLSGQYQ
jgi:hypothetical protein